ncbi:MAG: ribonuclease R [Bacteroidales bacterium]|jgi:ribonuclease R|nr:ribonuclease R [Bacteroidales bacterium]
MSKKNGIIEIEKKIIEICTQASGVQYTYKQIAARLNVFDKSEREEVRKQIDILVDNKILLNSGRGKYRINHRFINRDNSGNHYIEGRVQKIAAGGAFIIQDDKDVEDVFIPEDYLSNALHNDRVKVSVFPVRKKKRSEGQVVGIIERTQKQLVGIIRIKKDKPALFIPDNPLYNCVIQIPANCLEGARSGEKVVVVITEWKEGTRNPIGKVRYVLGAPGSNNVEMNAILAEFDFPVSFPKEVEDAAEKIKQQIDKENIKKRKDFRKITTFTIDPADAKDFDDAISYEKLPNGLHRVGVHIADVSHYVTSGSLIDEEAYNRATSVYLVDRTIPMLPETLCNNLCSLRPHEDKLCFSAVFDLDEEAKIHNEWFGKTIINSDRRFAYEEVQQIIEEHQGELDAYILPVHQLAQTLRKQRMEAHAINFNTPEVKFQLNEKGRPLGVFLKVEKEANFLIEEFMLLANKKVAEKIGRKTARQQQGKTFVYRIHDEPIKEKLLVFRNFVQKLGYDLKTGSKKQLADSFNLMFDQSKLTGEHDMLNRLSVRLMPRAIYTTQNIGHYGLGFPYYTHFTSPIRRYPDLMVHRLFEAYLHNEPSANQDEYEEKCVHSSKMEHLAAEAERASIKYKQAEYLSDKIGNTFEAVISGLSKYGVFAELADSKCEGYIPMRCFDDDYYYLDEENYTLVGLHHGMNLRFGDKIMIKVTAVDILKKQMSFDFVKKIN